MVKKMDFKTFDLIFQTVPIALIYLPTIFIPNMSRAGLFVIALFFLLPYQVISSVILIARGLYANKLNRFGLARLVVWITVAGIVILLPVITRNFWAPHDLDWVFENKQVFTIEFLFVFYLIPSFYFLTLIEKIMGFVKKESELAPDDFLFGKLSKNLAKNKRPFNYYILITLVCFIYIFILFWLFDSLNKKVSVFYFYTIVLFLIYILAERLFKQVPKNKVYMFLTELVLILYCVLRFLYPNA